MFVYLSKSECMQRSTPEKIMEEKIKKYADAIEFFISNPEAFENMQNKVTKAFIKKMKENLEKSSNDNQMQLSVLNSES